MTKSSASKNSSDFICPYCDKKYKREAAFLEHTCKQKKRFLDRDTRPVRLAYHAFSLFMKVHFFRETSYEKFAKSPSYDAFVRFGKYVLDVNAISHLEFIDHMVRSGVKVDRWCDDAEYMKFVSKILMSETPHRALERTCILLHEWAIKNKTTWQSFFKEAAPPLVVSWIRSGKLSPWVILNCRSGQQLLERLSTEQKAIIAPSINTRVWLGKFQRHELEVADIRQALEEEGL